MRITGEIDESGTIRPYDKTRFNSWLEKNHGKRVYITMSKEKKTRSLPQNSYYHSCVVAPLADHFGDDTESMHINLKAMFLSEVRLGKPNKIKSTTDLSTAEMETYLDQIRIWALREYQFLIALPNEAT